MKLRIAVALTFVFIVVVNFSCRRKNESRPPQSLGVIQANYEAERYAVLSAIIRDMYVDERTRLLVIASADPCPTPDPTETPDPKVEEMRQQIEQGGFQGMPELERETIDDFHARAKECHPLARKLDIPIDYELVGPKVLEQLFPKGEFDRAWSRFYTKYPKSSGIISFSNPGFNRDYTQAVVSTGRGCGGLCGAGYMLLLTKSQNVWTVKTKQNIWVS